MNDGSKLLYASRFGGGGDDKGAALAVDTAGHAYITGSASSADFPALGSLQGFGVAVSGALTATMAFVTKLNTQGSDLWYSTLFGGGGGDAGAGIAVDGIGDVAVAGQTGSTYTYTASSVRVESLRERTDASSPNSARQKDAAPRPPRRRPRPARRRSAASRG